MYQPSTGGFNTRDPAFAATGTAYTYAGGDPVNENDPTGLVTEYKAGMPARTPDPQVQGLQKMPARGKFPASEDRRQTLMQMNSPSWFTSTRGKVTFLGRPSLSEIETALEKGTPQPLPGQNSVQFEYGGVRVIINEDLPTRSTAYYPGR
jgi:hypothetical protein